MPIYLDYAATTPVDPRVAEAIIPWLSEYYGNAASRTHQFGWEAEDIVKKSREQIAKLIKAKPEEVIFTSGATEAINLAIKGLYESYKHQKNHIITLATEHKAVLDTCKYLETQGAEVTYLPVQANGLVLLSEIEDVINENTLLVTVMYANNETGVIQPINDIARISHKYGSFFMTDATQALGKIPIDVSFDEIDLMCVSSHKLYGPKGVGALYVKNQIPKINLSPIIHGGGHERGMRSGTLNVAGIVGFGEACKISSEVMSFESAKLSLFRDELENLLVQIECTSINGIDAPRLPNITNVCFRNISAEALIMNIREKLAIASGSACTSNDINPSHVLMAMYEDEDVAYSSVRLSYGRFLDEDPIKVFEIIESIVHRINNSYSM